jgi:hypothetical protein
MAREYHIAAMGGSNDDEVSFDLADVLNTLDAQDRELRAAIPVILSREEASTSTTGGVQ